VTTESASFQVDPAHVVAAQSRRIVVLTEENVMLEAAANQLQAQVQEQRSTIETLLSAASKPEPSKREEG
jgi:hypothetical protein